MIKSKSKSKSKASILCFPQHYAGNEIKLRILVIPRENPLSPLDIGLPEFAKAKLKFVAKFIPSLEFLPSAGKVLDKKGLITLSPVDAKSWFTTLKDTFNISLDSNVLRPLPKSSTYIQKYLPRSYRNAFDFSHPRSKYAVTNDEYLCAMKKESPPGTKTFTTNEVSWGKVFALALRQPLLAEKLGMLYKTEVELPNADYFKEGGWIYVDLAEESDYYEQDILIKKYAARLPRLTEKRVLFSPVQFLVTDTPPSVSHDHLFIESETFDDGFANIVHCAQPQKANLILEADQDGLSPIKDYGIRIGWEDEQILDWHNRLLRRPDYSTPPLPGEEIIDAPVGILAYRIDVRNVDAPDEKWHSLNKAKGHLKISNSDLGLFEGELGVEVAPTQMDGFKEGVFWLPSYFTQWDGNSVVLRDDQAAILFGLSDGTPRAMQPVDIDEVPLRYENTYQFRVRMADMSGGGPTENDEPFFLIPSQITSCRFRRFVPPSRLRIPSEDEINIPETDPEENSPTPAPPPASYDIYRPLLGYPAVLYSGFYPNAFALLKADINKARAESREPALPDPDVTLLKIEVSIQGLEMDYLLSEDDATSYYPLFTTYRSFPIDPTQALKLEVEFKDANKLKFGDPADLGDLPLTGATGKIILPSARNIRMSVTPVGKEDALLKYFGAEWARFGKPTEIFTRSESLNEKNLFVNDVPSEMLKAMYFQPDEVPSKSQQELKSLSGLKGQSTETLMNRLANTLDLDTQGMTLIGKPGQRMVFGCCKEMRHYLSPEKGSITFSSKADLINHWVIGLIITIDRDWSWDALQNRGLTIFRNEEEVGYFDIPRTINNVALQNPDRSKTTFIFFDAFDPKSGNDRFPTMPELEYVVKVNYTSPPNQGDNEKNISVTLPVTIKPAQVPKIASAGIALSPYERDLEGYKWTKPRQKMLWLEFEEPVSDPNDNYFVFVKAYAPDPLLIYSGEPINSPEETQPYIDPEPIRVITPGQSKDRSGLNAMQQLIPAAPASPEEKAKHFLVPLPPGLSESSPELFGFFTYEICLGHANEKLWSTAQGRYGRPIRISGVQHPAPSLICNVSRDDYSIKISAAYAAAVYRGQNLAKPPQTELWALLYAQVVMIDGTDYRNILLMHQYMNIDDRNRETYKLRQWNGYCELSNKEVQKLLEEFALPSESTLSCMVIEVSPNHFRDIDPLGGDLGFTRIFRSSQLEPVPEICCVDC